MVNKLFSKLFDRHYIILVIFLLIIISDKVFATNGCNLGDSECGSIPSDNCDVTQNTTFNSGTYTLPNGIDICVSNITLDCNGATLDGSVRTKFGISIDGPSNITITNCTVFFYDRGIFLSSSDNNTITYNNILTNAYGIFIRSSSYNTFANNHLNGNIEGFYIESGSSQNNIFTSNNASGNARGFSGNPFRNTFTNNTANTNWGTGFSIYDGYYNIFINNNANSNADGGMYFQSSSNNLIINNTMNGNSQGIIISGSNNTLIGNNVSANIGVTCISTSYGIAITSSSSNNTLINNIANGNTNTGGECARGIQVEGLFNTLINNIANLNSQVGITADGSYLVFINNTANFNGWFGIGMGGGNSKTFIGNNASNNGRVGIDIYASYGNTLTGNIVNNNGQHGIHMHHPNSVGNFLVGNTFCSNNRSGGFYFDISNENVNTSNFGNDNACDTSYNWIDAGEVSGCTFVCFYPELTIITQFIQSILLGVFSSQQLKAAGGTPPYTWSLVNGTIPNGMSLSNDSVFSGTPTEAGNFIFTVRVTDSNNSVAEKQFTIIIYVTLPPAHLSIKKVGTRAVPGRILDYFIAVENIGNSPAENLSIVEFLEPEIFNLTFTNPLAFVEIDPEYPEFQYVLWNLLTFVVNEVKILNYKAKLNASIPLGTEVVGGPICIFIEEKLTSECKDVGPDEPFPNSPLQETPLGFLEVCPADLPSHQGEGGYHCRSTSQHKGVDLKIGIGKNVTAVDQGKVTVAQGGFEDFGKAVFIDHGDGCVSKYAHLSEINVAVDQKVLVGQVIGKSGESGNAVGLPCSHLHFQYECAGKEVNPCTGLGNPTNCFCRCKDKKCTEFPQITVTAIDPNEKGVINNKFIQPNETLTYTVHFENIGSVEALDVFVNDTLDYNLDTSTLEVLTPNGTFIPLPQNIEVILLERNKTKNQTIGNITINITIEEKWTALLQDRKISWRLLGIELQPNATETLLFSIKPISGLPSGTKIYNNATIQFEIFENITTNNTINIIDNIKPQCIMNNLSNITIINADKKLNISWNGYDNIGEIESYTIFTSVNYSGFSPVINNTDDTAFNFTTEIGKTYSFICIAKDTADNVEIQEPIAETSTLVKMCGDVNDNSQVTLADIIALVNYIFNKPGGPWVLNFDAADVNNNGKITLADAISIVNYIFNKPGGPWLNCG